MNAIHEVDQINRHINLCPVLENHSSLATRKSLRLQRNWSAFKRIRTFKSWASVYFQKWTSLPRIWTKELTMDMPALANVQTNNYFLFIWVLFHCHEHRSCQLFQKMERSKRARMGVLWGRAGGKKKKDILSIAMFLGGMKESRRPAGLWRVLIELK